MPGVFQFNNLKSAYLLSQRFLEEYEQLVRNSGSCKKLWIQVILFQAIVQYMRDKVGQQFDFGLDGFLPSRFVNRRTVEQKVHLSKIEASLKQAVKYVKTFNKTRRNYTKSFGENAKVYKLHNKNHKGYDKLLEGLTENVKSWHHFVGEEEAQDAEDMAADGPNVFMRTAEPPTFREVVEKFREHKLKDPPVLDWSVSLVKELKDKLNEMETKVLWKRLVEIIPAVEDINDDLKEPQLTELLALAKDKQEYYQNMKKRRGKAKRKNTLVSVASVSSFKSEAFMSDIPGIQAIGPLTVLPIPKQWVQQFNFDISTSSLKFSADLSGFLVDAKNNVIQEKIVHGKTSPVVNVGMNDREALVTLKVPRKAKYFSFVYPTDDQNIRVKKQQGADGSPINERHLEAVRSLLTFGGFVYYDKKYKMVRLNALRPKYDHSDYFDSSAKGPKKLGMRDMTQEMEPVVEGPNYSEDIHLMGPYIFSDREDFKAIEKIQAMESAGRFSEVIRNEWQVKGVSKFAWLKPGELKKDSPCALLFIYETEGYPPVYFEILDPQAKKNASSGNRALLRKILTS